jgi:hypothetical protein
MERMARWVFLRRYGITLSRGFRNSPEDACNDAIVMTGMVLVEPLSRPVVVVALMLPALAIRTKRNDLTAIVVALALVVPLMRWVGKRFGTYVDTNRVVPMYAPGVVAPVQLKSTDWKANKLTLELDRVPEAGWVQRFAQPREGYSSLQGAAPSQFRFSGNVASVAASSHNAKAIVDYFKGYLLMATRGFQEDLMQAARTQEHEEQRGLDEERAAAETRARVLNSLKI